MTPQSQDSSKEGWRTRNVWGFSLASLFSDMGHELVTAVLPAFLLTIGAPVIALGVIEGVSNLSQSLAALWGGNHARWTSKRKWLVVAGYVLTGFKALIALVFYWPWIVLIRTAAWVGRGERGPIRDTVIAEEVTDRNRGKAYGFRETFDTLGAIAGPLAAAVLISVVPARTLIALSAIPAVLTIAVIVIFFRDRTQPHAQPAPSVNELRAVWPRAFRQFRRAAVIFSIGAAPPTFFILRVLQMHVHILSLKTAALGFGLYTVHNIFYAGSSFPAGMLSDRGRMKGTAVIGYLLWAAALAGFAVLPQVSPWVWLVLFVVSGFSTGLIETGQKAMTAQIAPAQLRGKALGQIAGLRGFSQFAGTLLLGGLWTLGYPAWGFVVMAAAALTGSFLMMAVPSPVSAANESGHSQ